MSVASGIWGAQSSKSSSKKQAKAAITAGREANATQLQMFREGQAATAPWRKAGERALTTLESKIAAGPGDYTSSPGYEFRLSEGNKAIERSAAAKGNLLSGATLKSLDRYNQDYATNDYQNFLANYYASLTPYQSLAGVGQTTALQNAVQGDQVASRIGTNTINAGNVAGQAQASGIINQSNAITGAIDSGVNNYMLWKYMQPAAGAYAGASAAYGGTYAGSSALANAGSSGAIYDAGYANLAL